MKIANLQQAKKFPIEKLYPGQLKRSGKIFIGKCLFHNDHSPSLAIYPDTNSFFCFAGCGGGDSITFLIKLYSIDFKEAIMRLSI